MRGCGASSPVFAQEAQDIADLEMGAAVSVINLDNLGRSAMQVLVASGHEGSIGSLPPQTKQVLLSACVSFVYLILLPVLA